MNQSTKPSRSLGMLLPQAVAWLGIAVFTLGLGLFAYTGTYSRYWADDYCYAGVANSSGLIQGTWEWYRDSGNRFSAFWMVGISEWFGAHAISVLPALALILWTAAWVFFLSRFLRLLQWHVALRWQILLATMLVYFNVLLAPDRLQTLYWRMGTLHYTLPLVVLLLNLALMAQALARPEGWNRAAAFAVAGGLLAFFAGGLSETYAAMQTGLFGLLGLGALIVYRVQPKLRRRALTLLSGLLAGALLAMLVEFLSPSNAWRQAALPSTPGLLQLIVYSLRYSWDFTRESLRGQPLPLLILALAAGCVSFLAFSAASTARFSAKARLIGLALSLGLGFGLIVCSFAPSAFAGLQYPAGRALMPARFAFLVGLLGFAFFAADWARALLQAVRPGWAAAAAVVVALLLLAACIYPLRMLDLNRREITTLALKAQRWDTRDAQIRLVRANGVRDIQVQQTDVVQTLEDIGPDSTFWINRCAALYYRVGSITAKP